MNDDIIYTPTGSVGSTGSYVFTVDETGNPISYPETPTEAARKFTIHDHDVGAVRDLIKGAYSVNDIRRDIRPIVEMVWVEGFKDSGGWSFLTPDFKRAFVEQLKGEIPTDERSYDPATHAWTVSWEYGQTVAELLEEFFKADILWVECDE